MASKDLHGMLGALKELKAEYMIGSEAAFKHLKVRSFFDQIIDQIRHDDPILVESFSLTTRRVGWLADSTKTLLSIYLDMFSCKASSINIYSLYGSGHVFLYPLRVDEGCAHDETGQYLWTCDYKTIIHDFLDFFVGDHGTEMNQETAAVLAEWLGRRLGDEALQPIYQKTNQPVSLSMFVATGQFREEDVDEFWDHFETEIKWEKEKAPEERSWPEADLQLAEQALESQNLALAHSLAQAKKLHSLMSYFLTVVDELAEVFAAGFIDADNLLYDYHLYDRAAKEYTLGLYETERRLALYQVHQFQRSNGSLTSPAALVEGAIKEANQWLSKWKASKERNPHDPYADHNIARYHYIRQALHQNKRWLINFLSR